MILKDFEWGIESFSYSLGFTFIIFVFPVLFSVIVFKYLLKNYIQFKKVAFTFLIQFLLLFLIIQASLICWAIFDMQFLDFDYEYTFQNILKAYKENYLDFAPVSFLIPFSIIYFDYRYHNRNNVIDSGNGVGFENKS